jgi:hypothetical protein
VVDKFSAPGALKPIVTEVTDPKSGKTVTETTTPSVEEATKDFLATKFAIIQPNQYQPENM